MRRSPFKVRATTHVNSRGIPHPHHSRAGRSRRSRRLTSVVAAVAAAALLGSASATAGAVGPGSSPARLAASVTDYCGGQCYDILPPGANGNETLAQIILFKLFGVTPSNNQDELAPYANLVTSATGLTASQINNFYNSSALGVPSSDIQSTESPETGSTIIWDNSGIPHVYGKTRAETEFGSGYAGAQDRLWVMDLLRHLGRAELTSFAGGDAGNQSLEQNLWHSAPYTESQLQTQVTEMESDGAAGAQVKADIDAYLNGVNTFISNVQAADDFPGEYDLASQSIAPFTETDMIAIAGVIGALFGNGGGEQLQSALVKEAAEQEYGVAAGDQIWSALREQNDPEATLTVHNGQTFPYGEPTAPVTGTAMPDPGSVAAVAMVQNGTGTGTGAAVRSGSLTTAPTSTAKTPVPAASKAEIAGQVAKISARVPVALRSKVGALAGIYDNGALPGVDVPAPGQQHPGMSNALVVSGADTQSGNPIAAFGPQTGYFAPQLLMLEEVEGPGISARGVSFAGLNFYVEIGRGPSYSWSATSGEQGTEDTFAVSLCNTNGSPATTASTAYLYDGVCTPMQKIEASDSWSPTLADETAAGSYNLVMYNTNYGLEEYTATVGGVPVAYTIQRSSYMHEGQSVLGFMMFNNPADMATPAEFQTAASNIGYDFNWFYVNSTHTAYYNSGMNPVRAPSMDPNLPAWGNAANEWVGWNPATDVADYTPPSQHPNSTDQDYYVSWNNKQALGYSAADGNYSYGPVQRVDLLNNGIKSFLATGQKFTETSLVQVMEKAATTDLRGSEVLPLLLDVINSAPVTDPTQQALVSELTAWQQAATTLTPTSAGATSFQNAAAIELMDAWWPMLIEAEFEPGMGANLFGATVADMQVNDSPSGGQQITASGSVASDASEQSHKGSAFQFGWWGYVSKDLRSVLGQPVQDALPVQYCGAGSLSACRTALLTSLSAAAAESPDSVYAADSYCSAGDQWCADSIVQSPLGGITDPQISWQNRPTYQQVVSFPSAP